MYICEACTYVTSRIDHYEKHLGCKKHLIKTKVIDSKFKCPTCGTLVSNKYNLNRHVSSGRCKIVTGNMENALASSLPNAQASQSAEPVMGQMLEIIKKQSEIIKDLQVGVTNSNNSLNSDTNSNNNTNQTQNNNCQVFNITYLNKYFDNIPGLASFIDSLQDTYKINNDEANMLFDCYHKNGVIQYGNYLTKLLKDKYYLQLLEKEIDIIPNTRPFPIALSDGNLRSHNEKMNHQWERIFSNESLLKMINVINGQIYRQIGKAIYLNCKEMTRICAMIKKANGMDSFSGRDCSELEQITNVPLTEEIIETWPEEQRLQGLATLRFLNQRSLEPTPN